MRVGLGYDVHRLVTGRKLILGGVDIPFQKGLAGHSDADVLLHAVCDALLGAAGLGDIGKHFPDNDNKYKDIDSTILLKKVYNMLLEKNIRVVNVDATVIAEEPKISPYTPKIVKNIAQILELDEKYINVKATTTEGLGFTGEKKGIAVQAIASIAGNE